MPLGSPGIRGDKSVFKINPALWDYVGGIRVNTVWDRRNVICIIQIYWYDLYEDMKLLERHEANKEVRG